MRICQINMVDFGSTGKIMLQIADAARKNGAEVKTFSTRQQSKRYTPMPIPQNGHEYYGSFVGNNLHYLRSQITGEYGCFSRIGTFNLLRRIKAFNPDVIHLHNMHSAFLHLPMLLDYVKKNNIPLVWTLHDCWIFTGKCPHFNLAKCDKWKYGCYKCPQMSEYPRSYLDASKKMWHRKKRWFTGINQLVLVTPSQWLADLTRQSFLKDYPVKVINNGIDLSVFKPTQSDFRKENGCEDKFILLGVAFGWGKRKGLDVFEELAKRLDSTYQIVLVGTDENVEKQLPANIISIRRTQNQQELAMIYTAADLFVNPTREENYPTVNMEALACGTPVLTFRTGGSPEIIDETCGGTVDCDDVQRLINEIYRIQRETPYAQEACLKRAESFDMYSRFEEYVDLYKQCIN